MKELIQFFKIYFGKYEQIFEWNFHSLSSVSISGLVQQQWSPNDSAEMKLSMLYLCHKRLGKELVAEPKFEKFRPYNFLKWIGLVKHIGYQLLKISSLQYKILTILFFATHLKTPTLRLYKALIFRYSWYFLSLCN